MTQAETKQCSICRQEKNMTEFHRNKAAKDGLRNECKQCRAIYHHIYYMANREKELAYDRAWQAEHREQKAANNRAYYMANHEEITAQHRAWQKANPDKVSVYSRAWAKANLEKINGYSRHRRVIIAGAAIGPIDYEAVRKRDQDRCCVCGKRVAKKDLSFDHTIPLSLGGPHTQGNLRVCHRRCNSRRGPGRLPVQRVLV